MWTPNNVSICFCRGLFAAELFLYPRVDTMMPASDVAFAGACAPGALQSLLCAGSVLARCWLYVGSVLALSWPVLAPSE